MATLANDSSEGGQSTEFWAGKEEIRRAILHQKTMGLGAPYRKERKEWGETLTRNGRLSEKAYKTGWKRKGKWGKRPDGGGVAPKKKSAEVGKRVVGVPKKESS